MGEVVEFKARAKKPAKQVETWEQIAARIYDGIVLPDLSEASHYHLPDKEPA